MSYETKQKKLVLSLHPFTRGFGYAVFEGPLDPIDWGVKEVRADKNASSLQKIEAMIDLYQPDVVVIEDACGEGSRRGKRIRSLLSSIKTLAAKNNIKTKCYSRRGIRQAFETIGASTKFEISRAIAGEWPELESHLPPFRKPWMSEDSRMSMFDAIALAVTFFHREKEKQN